MGWDAYSDTGRFGSTPNNEHLYRWRVVALRVRRVAGSCDGDLEDGGLDCSACAEAIEAATGEDCWTETPWDAERVKRVAANAKWPNLKDVPTDDRWAVASAKAFIETCADLGVGIHFSY